MNTEDMNFAQLDATHYLIRLHKGEEVLTALKQFAQSKNCKNASFTAIGSVQDPTLAFYSIAEKKFHEKNIAGFYELISSLGTIAVYNDEVIVHTHVSVSDESLQTFAGHLVKATVSATVEISLTVFPTAYTKKDDEETGLKLWDLPENLQ